MIVARVAWQPARCRPTSSAGATRRAGGTLAADGQAVGRDRQSDGHGQTGDGDKQAAGGGGAPVLMEGPSEPRGEGEAQQEPSARPAQWTN